VIVGRQPKSDFRFSHKKPAQCAGFFLDLTARLPHNPNTSQQLNN